MTKPSLELLRSMTDEHVLRAIMQQKRLTRAEIASTTGISKPTVSGSVQRLAAQGLLVDTGERTSGRGRVGSYYSLATECGSALVASITPRGVRAEAVDAFGQVVARSEADLDRSAGEEVAAETLATAAGELRAEAGLLRCAVVSAADPVDRTTGRLVPLPDVPFLVGQLDPVAVLEPYVTEAVLADNDVNWAARAEHRNGSATGVDDFAYVHLGEGLGCAIVHDGQVRRGHNGLTGEIAHVCTPGPDGAAMPLTQVFAELGLRCERSTAIDVEALRNAVTAKSAELDVLARAVSGVLSSVVALADPQRVVLGGPWGSAVVQAVAAEFTRSPRNAPVEPALIDNPEEAGARAHAVEVLRERIVAASRPS